MADELRLPPSAAEVTSEIADAIERAGLHSAHAFAVRQCGFLVTEMNRDTFTDAEIDQWEEALDRWFEMHPDDPGLAPGDE